MDKSKLLTTWLIRIGDHAGTKTCLIPDPKQDFVMSVKLLGTAVAVRRECQAKMRTAAGGVFIINNKRRR